MRTMLGMNERRDAAGDGRQWRKAEGQRSKVKKRSLTFSLSPFTFLFCLLPLAFSFSLAQDWTWNGSTSPNWSDLANWSNGANNPASLYVFTNGATRPIIRIGEVSGGGKFLPSNQDIPGIVLNTIQIDMQHATRDLVVSGEPITMSGSFQRANSLGTVGKTVFSNDFVFIAGTGMANYNLWRPLHFHGTFSESPGVTRNTRFYENDGVCLFGEVKTTGFFANVIFHGMKTTGGNPASPVDDFFTSNLNFNPPPGHPSGAAFMYEFPKVKGLAPTGGRITLPAGVTAVFNGPVTGNGELWFGDKSHADSIVEFNNPANTWTGGLRLEGGLFIFRGTIPKGTVATPTERVANGAVDLDGVDLLGRDMQFWQTIGHNGDGIYRNQNPDRPSEISGNIVKGISYGTSPRTFGGVGDILFSGDITEPNNFETWQGTPYATSGNFVKFGAGTLTMTGSNLYTNGPTIVYNGTLSLDHIRTNSNKIAERPLTLLGNLSLFGNPKTNTVQTVTALTVGAGAPNPLCRIRVAGRGGHDATLRFSTYAHSGDDYQNNVTTLDFAPGTNGFIKTSAASNDANTGTLYPLATFNGKSFARVSDDPADKDGCRAIEPCTNYFKGFAGAGSNSLVDIPAGVTTVSANTTAAAIRFNEPGKATLTVNRSLVLTGGAAYYKGAILVTPEVGANETVINGTASISDTNPNISLIVHQYNPDGALIISNCLFGSLSSGLGKTGPGELRLTVPSYFRSLYVHEGILTYNTIASNGLYTSVGNGDNAAPITLGNGTFRYKGEIPAGHVTDRLVRLYGFGVVEASGIGPLRFTAPVNFAPHGYGENRLLTLSGTGEGIIDGRLDLRGGRMRKRGAGTWTLNGDSPNIIWGCDVLEGTLVLNGTLGRDVCVGGADIPVCQSPASGQTGMSAPPCLTGTGAVTRNLIVHENGVIKATPGDILTVGNHLIIKSGASLALPNKLDPDWTTVINVLGKVEGEFTIPPHAYIRYDNGVQVKARPVGTLLMVR